MTCPPQLQQRTALETTLGHMQVGLTPLGILTLLKGKAEAVEAKVSPRPKVNTLHTQVESQGLLTTLTFERQVQDCCELYQFAI